MSTTIGDPGQPAGGASTARLSRPRATLLMALIPGVFAGLVLLSGVAALEWITPSATGPIYSLSAVRDALAHGQPGFLDRQLRVRAVVGVCTIRVSDCFDWQPVLVDDRRGSASGSFPVAWTPTLLTALRDLPLIGLLLPAPQDVKWGTRAVYRVAFHLVDGATCGARPCYQVDLLDAGQPNRASYQ